MNKNFSHLVCRSLLLSGTAASSLLSTAQASVPDLSAYVPTLDRHYTLPAQDPVHSPIGSGYTLQFTPVTNNDYDFVSYEVTKDTNVKPIYYKTNYAFNSQEAQQRIVSYGKKDSITGYFKNIKSTTNYPSALYNMSGNNKIDLIAADFINNEINNTSNKNAYGAALNNSAVRASSISVIKSNINTVVGDFIDNHVIGNGKQQNGAGAIMNIGNIGKLSGNFIGNYAKGDYQVLGGAIVNTSVLGIINGNFIGNHIEGHFADGGAIYNSSATYTINNSDILLEGVPSIPLIRGNFIGNYSIGIDRATGGAISNIKSAPDIYAHFIGNYVLAEKLAIGGAIASKNGINTITGNFIGNHAESKQHFALGGALYLESGIHFIADGLNNYFTGNYTLDSRGKIYNAIWVSGTSKVKLTFDITSGGNLYFNDSILSERKENKIYDIDIIGYGSGKFFMNNNIMNAGEVTVKDSMLVFNQAPYTDDAGCGSACRGQFIAGFQQDKKTPDLSLAAVTSLHLDNSQFYLHNDYIENVKLKNYTVNGNSLLHIDVSKQNGMWEADKISLSGQIEGSTQVVVYDRTNEDNRGASVLFIEAPNDTGNNKPGIFRVYGSPYKWDVAYNHQGEKSGSYWYLIGINEKNNPNHVGFVPNPIEIDDPFDLPEPPAKQEVTPETIAYQGLPAAALEQTRSMAGNVRNHAAADKFFAGSCNGSYSDAWDGTALKNIWVSPVHHTASIDSPSKIDADINGLEAGFDIQRNLYHKLGIFSSYRQGNYDLDGKSDEFRTYTGADIDIESYGLGFYYRYDYSNWQMFALLYGGVQKAEVKSDDGVGGESDGVELSGSVEVSYLYNISDSLKLAPSIGVIYNRVEFDDIHDSYGKTASYDNLWQTELAAGISLEKYLPTENGLSKLYFKPSLIQVLNGGDSVAVSGLGRTNGLDEATLGRFEVGGRYGFADRWSVFGWTNYTFGSDYQALSFGAGLNYVW